ncbi:MAG TPA: type II toxin-antitoxin system RelE/ParE family toxin [Candidatus Kapabacteria bacterium]
MPRRAQSCSEVNSSGNTTNSILVLCGSKKLSGKHHLYRIRMGDYRVIYEVQDDQLLILIVRAGNRREIYR